MSTIHLHLSPDSIYPFDARGIAKRFRHAAIFGALDALHPGETMRFVNDHDPLPLLQQLQVHYGPAVGIDYRQREPGNIVIDFLVQVEGSTAAAAYSAAAAGGGCGGGGGGGCCS